MLTVLFVLLKIWTRRGYVKLDNDVAVLQRAIEYLKQPKRERQVREEQKHSDVAFIAPSGAADVNNGNEQNAGPNDQEKVG